MRTVWLQTTCKAVPVCTCEHMSALGIHSLQEASCSGHLVRIFTEEEGHKRSSGIPNDACLGLRLPSLHVNFSIWILELVPALSHFTISHSILTTI